MRIKWKRQRKGKKLLGIKKDNKDNKNKGILEVSIQANFLGSDYFNENNDYEKDEEFIKNNNKYKWKK